MEYDVPIRIRGCRSNAPSRVRRTGWAGPAGHHRVWKRSVSPNMTVLARRVLTGIPGQGKACPSGRNGPGPPHCSRCNGQGLARPSGAKGSNHRTLAGATVGAWSTHRAHRTQHRAVLRAPRPIRSDVFVRARRTAVSDNLREVRGHRRHVCFPKVCRHRDPGCSDPAWAGHSGQPSNSGRTYERHRSWRKAVSVWRGNNRRASGTERCTAPREGKALKGATPRALLARNKARTVRGGVQGAQR
jgi:hypothetical protein